jgi:ferredoxin
MKCDGCGLCAEACHEGAIVMEGGKAKLTRDDYCDGLGDCLPVCPRGAISFEVRDADEYDAEAVKANMAQREQNEQNEQRARAAQKNDADCLCGCPGSAPRVIARVAENAENGADAQKAQKAQKIQPEQGYLGRHPQSRLGNWPVQIKLAPVRAPYFDGARLVIAADCCAYALAGFHEAFIEGGACLIGCPKLDGLDYSEKLAGIIAENDIKSVTVVRMEVPCCAGLENAVIAALKKSGKFIPWRRAVISVEGEILESS